MSTRSRVSRLWDATLPHPSLESVTHGFRALHVRNYRLFWVSQLISVTGSWMQTTAQAWLVVKLTESPLALGIVTTLQFLPVMLLTLFGGVIADRLPKRQTLIVTQTLLLIQATIFGVLVGSGAIQLWHVYVLAVIQGIISAIDTPVRQAFVVEMVGRDDLLNAVALNSMSFNLGRIMGPVVAGIVIAKIDIAPTLYLNAVSFVPVIVALWIMDAAALMPAPPMKRGSTLRQLGEGLRYIWQTPDVLVIFIVVAAIGTFGFNFTVVLPLLANFVVRTDATGFGALTACFGVGALLAATLTAYSRRATLRWLLIGAGAFSILLGASALSPAFGVTAALLVALGFTGIIFSTTSNTLLQLAIPDHLRGRVLSLYVLLFMGSTPVGGFLIGFLSDNLGVPVAMVTCGVLCVVGVVGALAYLHRAGYKAAKVT